MLSSVLPSFTQLFLQLSFSIMNNTRTVLKYEVLSKCHFITRTKSLFIIKRSYKYVYLLEINFDIRTRVNNILCRFHSFSI